MYAASRHGTPSLTSLPKDGGVSCFECSPEKVAHSVWPGHLAAHPKMFRLPCMQTCWHGIQIFNFTKKHGKQLCSEFHVLLSF